jgi:sulfite reductase beta subunit-like hemoprotein
MFSPPSSHGKVHHQTAHHWFLAIVTETGALADQSRFPFAASAIGCEGSDLLV